jgi:hypothetical protein
MKVKRWLLVLISAALLSIAITRPAHAAEQWGCFNCVYSYNGFGEPTWDCEFPFDGEWGQGIKCVVNRFGCDVSGGACLYVVFHSTTTLPAERGTGQKGAKQPVAATSSPQYAYCF